MLVSTISSAISLVSLFSAPSDRYELGAGGSTLLRAGSTATPDNDTQEELAIQIEPKVGLFRQTRRGSFALAYNNIIRIDLLRIWKFNRPPIFHQLSFIGDRKLSRAWNSILQLSGGFGQLDYVNQILAFDVDQSQSQRLNTTLATVASADATLLLTGKIAPRHSMTINLDGQYSNLANPELGYTLKQQFAQGRQQAGGTLILSQQSVVSRRDLVGSGASIGAFYFAENTPVPMVVTAYLSWLHRWTSESNVSVQTGAAVLSTDQAIEKKEAFKDQMFTGVAQVDINSLFYSTRDLRLQGQWSVGISPFVDPISAQAAPRLLTSSNLFLAIQPKWNGTLTMSFAAPIDVGNSNRPGAAPIPGPGTEPEAPSNPVVPIIAGGLPFADTVPKQQDPENPDNSDPTDQDPNPDQNPDENQVSFGQQQSIISIGVSFNYVKSEWLSFNWGATFNARGTSLNKLSFSSRQIDIFAFAGINFAINHRGRNAAWLR